jgi:hypothetical protein
VLDGEIGVATESLRQDWQRPVSVKVLLSLLCWKWIGRDARARTPQWAGDRLTV